MNEQQLIAHIEELGLSNKEARVYVASLKTGPAAVQRIADQAGIKRVTTYVILESLVGLGLVSQSIKGKKTYFIAEEPSNLQRLLEKREQELKEQRLNFDQVLPALLGLKTIPKDSPDVRFYDSADGIRSLFSTFFATHDSGESTVYGISNIDQLHSFFPELAIRSENPERMKRQLSSRFLYTSVKGPFFKQSDSKTNRESKWVPTDKFPLNGDITIFGKYVLIISLSTDRPIGITIKSADIAQSMRAIFELMWLGADQFDQNTLPQ